MRREHTSNISRVDEHCYTFTIRCGSQLLMSILVERLERAGLHYSPDAIICILVDTPCGFAIQCLERETVSPAASIVVTSNTCPEHWEDIWDLGTAALFVGEQNFQHLASQFSAITHGDRVRKTPPIKTPLTRAERKVLRKLASGLDNQQIAEKLVLSHQRIKSVLSDVYAKLDLRDRCQAILYYWDICPAIAQEVDFVEKTVPE